MTTTNEIADKIASEHGLTKIQGKAIVEAVFAAITAASTSGAETSIPGFGKFKVAAAKKLPFTPVKALKDALNK